MKFAIPLVKENSLLISGIVSLQLSHTRGIVKKQLLTAILLSSNSRIASTLLLKEIFPR